MSRDLLSLSHTAELYAARQRSKGMPSPELTKEQFIERFVTEMVSYCKTFDDGEPVEPYARDVALTYWDDPGQRAEGPEECARADISYWGEE